MTKYKVYLSLGGNLDNPLMRIKQAITLLGQQDVFQLEISHFYSTEPLHFESPHCFVNAVCSFWTRLEVNEVFLITQEIEKQLGKVKKPKNADRLIDIDILFYGSHQVNTADLEIPHPRWKERLFVLVPLADLTKDISVFVDEKIQHYQIEDLIEALKGQSVSMLEKNPHFQ